MQSLSSLVDQLAPKKVTGSFFSTKSFLFDPFLSLGDWVPTIGTEVEQRRLDPPAIGVVDITCKQAAFGAFYIGGILQYVDLEGVDKITFTAKKDVDWRSLIGIDCMVTRPTGFKSAYVKYQVLKDDYETWEIENIGVTEPIDAVWITSSPHLDTKISVDSILIEA